MKIKELYFDSSKWTQNYYSKNSSGNGVFPTNYEAVSWCLLGALKKCYGHGDTYNQLIVSIEREINGEITSWNDDPRRKFDDVKKLVEKLDI